jgi:hypothetical protein
LEPPTYWSQFEKKFQSAGHKNQWRPCPSTNMHTNKQTCSAWKPLNGARNLIHYHSPFQLYGVGGTNKQTNKESILSALENSLCKEEKGGL